MPRLSTDLRVDEPLAEIRVIRLQLADEIGLFEVST